MKLLYKLSAVFFILLIGGMAVLHLVTADKTYSVEEKRNLAKTPQLARERLLDTSFMDDVETYLADQFPFRSKLVGIKSQLEVAMGKNEAQNVFICKDKTLMENFLETDRQITNDTAMAIKDFAKKYSKSKVHMLLVPNAIGVYPEKLPKNVEVASQYEYIDNFYNILGDQVDCLDVRKAFENNKDVQLYYKTDHHWTTDAVVLACQVLDASFKLGINTNPELGVVCDNFIGSLASKTGLPTKYFTKDIIKVALPEKEDMLLYTVNNGKETLGSCYDTEALSGDDPYQVFFGGNYPELTIDTIQDNGKSILIFKDSYANSLIPFLIKHYKTIKVVDPRYYYDDIDMLMEIGNYDDVLFLYNVNTLSQDQNLLSVLKNSQWNS